MKTGLLSKFHAFLWGGLSFSGCDYLASSWPKRGPVGYEMEFKKDGKLQSVTVSSDGKVTD